MSIASIDVSAARLPSTEPDLTSYLDVEIHLMREAESYRVDIRLAGERLFSGGMRRLTDPWYSHGEPKADGLSLFEWVFANPKLREGWGQARECAERRRLRWWIDANAPELHGLPWELLHDGRTHVAAAADTPFSRYLPNDLPWGEAVVPRPLRVLAAIANPIDLSVKHGLQPVDVVAETAELQTALKAVSDQVQVDFLSGPITLRSLADRLSTGYHVLHIVAHGAFAPKTQRAGLYLQHADGTAHRVREEAFSARLAHLGHKPSLIVLAACESATRSSADAFIGFGPQLVRIGIPAVVAMQGAVTVVTARLFTATFYEQLLRHGFVDRAMNNARAVLFGDDRLDAFMPVLFMHLKNGQLLNTSRSSAEPHLLDNLAEPGFPWLAAEQEGDNLYATALSTSDESATTFQAAKDSYRTAQSQARRLKADPLNMARLHRKMGLCYWRLHKSEAALSQYAIGLELLAEIEQTADNAAERARLYLGQANCSADAHDFEQVEVKVLQGLEALEKFHLMQHDMTVDDTLHSEVGQIWNFLGICQMELHGNRRKMIDYLERADHAFDQAGDRSRCLSVGLNRATNLLHLGDYQEAIISFERQLPQFESLRPASLSRVFLNLAIAYTDAGNVKTALAYAEKSLMRAAEDPADPIGLLRAYEAKAEAYKEQAKSLTGVAQDQALTAVSRQLDEGRRLLIETSIGDEAEALEYQIQACRMEAEGYLIKNDLVAAQRCLIVAKALMKQQADLSPGMAEGIILVDARIGRARATMAGSRFDSVLRKLRQAYRGFVRQELLGRAIQAALDLAAIHWMRGEVTQARSYLRDPQQWAAMLHRIPDQDRIKQLLERF